MDSPEIHLSTSLMAVAGEKGVEMGSLLHRVQITTESDNSPAPILCSSGNTPHRNETGPSHPSQELHMDKSPSAFWQVDSCRPGTPGAGGHQFLRLRTAPQSPQA